MDIESPHPIKNVEKKLKKRKELDARMCKVRKLEQHELLQDCSNGMSSSDDISTNNRLVNSHNDNDFDHLRDRICRGCFSARALCLSLTVIASTISIITVVWIHIQMTITVDRFRHQLEKVSEEKNTISENYYYYQSQIQGLLGNQSQLMTNANLIHLQYENIINQFDQLNRSVLSILTKWDNAPELRDLPSRVQEANVNMAKFGSQLSSLTSKVTQLEQIIQNDFNGLQTFKEFKGSATICAKEWVQNKTKAMLDRMSVLETSQEEFISGITEQLTNETSKMNRNSKHVATLKEELINVTAKVVANENALKRIETKLSSTIH